MGVLKKKGMTLSMNARKKLTFGFAVAAVVLLLSSTAWACTVWKGKMTVTVNDTRTGTGGTVNGWGANSGMQNCPTKPWEGQARAHVGDSTGHVGSGVTVTVAGTTSTEVGICASKLAANTYDVNFLNTGTGDFVGEGAARTWAHDCMTGGHPKTFKIGSISVDSNGNGSVTIAEIKKPAAMGNEITDLPGTESAICVSDANASQGMQNPVFVV